MGQEEVALISFKCGNEVYGVRIDKVKEIIRYSKTVPIPKAPDFIDGVLSLRGMVIPIIDMRKKFGLPPSLSPKTRIIIIQVEGRIAGIIVDEVKRIVKVRKEEIQPPPEVAKGIGSEFLEGVCEDEEGILFLLNMDKVLTTKEKIILEESLKKKSGRGKK